MENANSYLESSFGDGSPDVSRSSYDSNNGGKSPLNRISNSIRRRKFACVECRQQKSKCDALDKAPEPCTKCAKKSVPCVLQKDYRRTYKRARNQAIEQRFKELTRTLSNLSANEIMKKIEEEQVTLLDNRNFTKDKIEQLKNPNESGSSSPYLPGLEASNYDSTSKEPVTMKPLTIAGMSKEQLLCAPKSLGEIYMSSEDIAELFQEFATKYHPFLPVVDLTKGTERIYSLSPCLFWVVLLVGLRRKHNAADLMTKLSASVKSILAEITIFPIIRYVPSDNDEPILNVASVYSVQAFLIYTFWPPLTSSLSADTSWNTIGTAMFQAIRVGLHDAEFSKEYSTVNSELTNEKVRTWVSCNIVSQIIASSFGFPAYVSFDHAVIGLTRGSHNNQNIPNSIKQMAQIAHFENQIINTINSNPLCKFGTVSAAEKQSLLNVLSQQLNELELQLEEDNLDSIRKFLLLVSKVHLLTNYFSDSNLIENGMDTHRFALSTEPLSFDSKRGLVRVYNSAIELLSHADEMWQNDATIIKYFPGVFVLNIWQSACIISKLAHSSLSSVLDIPRGKKVYQKAVILTFNASVLKHDMAYRSSGIMRSMWSLFSNMFDEWRKNKTTKDNSSSSDYNLGLIIKSRMSVSVFFDCLYILKEKCGMAKLERERTQRLEEEEEDEYEDERIYNKSKMQSAGERNSKVTENPKLLGLQDPEEKARKIIKTIPLDPHPINADSSNSGESNSETPSRKGTEGLSSKKALYRAYTHNDQLQINQQTRAVTTSPNGYENSKLPTGTSSNNDSVTSAPANINIPSSFNLLNEHKANLINGSNGREVNKVPRNNMNQIINQGNMNLKDSPNSMMGSWDNWESDLVWKDVDLLMNEFAFNPAI